MSNQANVHNLEVFANLRLAILKFAQAADTSLASADSHISRMRFWLENEQTTYWQQQLRKRTEMVTLAKEAVRKKKLYKDSSGKTPSAVEEEKYLAKCKAALDEAQEKAEMVRKWMPRLDKAGDMYRGGVSRLQTTLAVDIPRAVALLDRLAGSLEEYVQLEAPAMPTDALPPMEGESFARGGEAAGEPAPKEAPHVADGQ